MKLVEISPLHGEILAKLHKDGFEEQWQADAFVDLINMPASFGCLAVFEDDPVGFILCQGDAVECEIITIATRSDYRRQGIAEKMLNEVLLRTQRMFLEVGQDNKAARLFYEKQGFVQVGVRKTYYKRPNGMQVDALVMAFTPAV